MSENNLYRQDSENKTGNRRKKEGKIMNRKSIVAIVAAALLGVGAVSYVALRPQTGSEAALPVAVQPAEDNTSAPDAVPEAPDTSLNDPAEDAADTTETTETTSRAADSAAAEKEAPSATETPTVTGTEIPAAEQTAAADTTVSNAGGGAVQVGDEQQTNSQPGGDSQQQGGGQNTPSQPSAQGTVQAADVLALTNQERQASGLAALSASSEQSAADTRAPRLILPAAPQPLPRRILYQKREQPPGW